jgi:hypothetical protein
LAGSKEVRESGCRGVRKERREGGREGGREESLNACREYFRGFIGCFKATDK